MMESGGPRRPFDGPDGRWNKRELDRLPSLKELIPNFKELDPRIHPPPPLSSSYFSSSPGISFLSASLSSSSSSSTTNSSLLTPAISAPATPAPPPFPVSTRAGFSTTQRSASDGTLTSLSSHSPSAWYTFGTNGYAPCGPSSSNQLPSAIYSSPSSSPGHSLVGPGSGQNNSTVQYGLYQHSPNFDYRGMSESSSVAHMPIPLFSLQSTQYQRQQQTPQFPVQNTHQTPQPPLPHNSSVHAPGLHVLASQIPNLPPSPPTPLLSPDSMRADRKPEYDSKTSSIHKQDFRKVTELSRETPTDVKPEIPTRPISKRPIHSMINSDSSPNSKSLTHKRVTSAPGEFEGEQPEQPKKRRGNLPKPVTDILRTWLIQHIQHPYPTEAEKLDLMQQTGLSINQISNWFINARRRRVPSLSKES